MENFNREQMSNPTQVWRAIATTEFKFGMIGIYIGSLLKTELAYLNNKIYMAAVFDVYKHNYRII